MCKDEGVMRMCERCGIGMGCCRQMSNAADGPVPDVVAMALGVWECGGAECGSLKIRECRSGKYRRL